MRHTESRLPVKALAVSVAFSLLVVGWGWLKLETHTVERLAVHLFWPLVRLLVFITIGLVVGQTIEATGWTRRLAVVAAPLFRFSHLGDRCSAAFTTSFVSGVAANAMLWEFFKEEKITRRQLFLGNLMNQFPAYFLHLPTTFFIVIPLTGRAGALYFFLTFVALVARTWMVMLYGRWFCQSDRLAGHGLPDAETTGNGPGQKGCDRDDKTTSARTDPPYRRICGADLHPGFHGQRHGRV